MPFHHERGRPLLIGIVLTQQLAERQVTWTLSVAPRNTPLAKD